MPTTIPTTTITELGERISVLIDWAEGRDDKWTAWVTGDVDGGPMGDGRYPLPYSETEDVLVECPALLANMVVGPAAEAIAAAASVEGVSAEAAAALVTINAAIATAQAARDTALGYRDAALGYRDTAANHASNADADRIAAENARTAAQVALSDTMEVADEVAATAITVAADKTAAQTARTGAEAAKAAAETAAASVDGPALLAAVDAVDGRVDVHETRLDDIDADLVELASSASDPKAMMRIMLALSALQGTTQFGTPNGVSDDFADTDGVDAAGSTNESYDAANKEYDGASPTGGASWTAPALMTGAASPTGYTARASSEFGATMPAWRVRDGVLAGNDNARWASGAGLPQWVEVKMPAAAKYASYTLKSTTDLSAALDQHPKSWSLYGHSAPMGGSGGTLLDTRTNVAAWTLGETRTYPIATPQLFAYYELRITANQGSAVATTIYEWTFTPADPDGSTPNPLDLRSVAYTAASVPTKASLLVTAKRTGGITLGTNLRAYIGRTATEAWQEVTLTAREVVSGYTFYEALNVSLASLPSGTSMRWRVTSDGVDQPISVGGVALLWN